MDPTPSRVEPRRMDARGCSCDGARGRASRETLGPRSVPGPLPAAGRRLEGSGKRLEEVPLGPVRGAEAGQVLRLHLTVDEVEAPPLWKRSTVVTKATFEASSAWANMLSPKKAAPRDTPYSPPFSSPCAHASTECAKPSWNRKAPPGPSRGGAHELLGGLRGPHDTRGPTRRAPWRQDTDRQSNEPHAVNHAP
jgi:hypothetical protein